MSWMKLYLRLAVVTAIMAGAYTGCDHSGYDWGCQNDGWASCWG